MRNLRDEYENHLKILNNIKTDEEMLKYLKKIKEEVRKEIEIYNKKVELLNVPYSKISKTK